MSPSCTVYDFTIYRPRTDMPSYNSTQQNKKHICTASSSNTPLNQQKLQNKLYFSSINKQTKKKKKTKDTIKLYKNSYKLSNNILANSCFSDLNSSIQNCPLSTLNQDLISKNEYYIINSSIMTVKLITIQNITIILLLPIITGTTVYNILWKFYNG